MKKCTKCEQLFNPNEQSTSFYPHTSLCKSCNINQIVENNIWELAEAMYSTWSNHKLEWSTLLPGEKRYWFGWARRLADTGCA